VCPELFPVTQLLTLGQRGCPSSNQPLGLVAFCVRESIPPSNDVHVSDSRVRSTHRRPSCTALDLPPRWIGLYSVGTPGQLRHSTSGEHGCANGRLVRAQAGVMVLLRVYGNSSVIGAQPSQRKVPMPRPVASSFFSSGVFKRDGRESQFELGANVASPGQTGLL